MKALFERRIPPSPHGLPGIRLFEGMSELRKELGESYVHPQNKKGDIDRDKIHKANDHACDAARYALYSFATLNAGGSYKPVKVRGWY